MFFVIVSRMCLLLTLELSFNLVQGTQMNENIRKNFKKIKFKFFKLQFYTYTLFVIYLIKIIFYFIYEIE